MSLGTDNTEFKSRARFVIFLATALFLILFVAWIARIILLLLFAAILCAVLLSTAGWLLSGQPERFLAVLVIATPCPLILAIPIAIIGTISLSAKRGIVIKKPVVLEQVGNVRTMFFDKTGTLTHGEPVVTEIASFSGSSRTDILATDRKPGAVFQAPAGRRNSARGTRTACSFVKC